MNAILRRVSLGGARSDRGRASLKARWPRFIGLDAEPDAAVRRMRGCSLVLVGCGAVGRVAAGAVARFHPARLVVVDPKPASTTSALTGLMYRADEVGRGKAELVAAEVREAAPETEVFEFAGPVQELPLTVWLEADAVLVCADNLAAELYVGEWCHRLGLKLGLANVHGASVVAQVRYLGNQGADSACPGCGYGAEEWALAEREFRFSCDGDAEAAAAGLAWPGREAPPTRTTAHLGALAGALAANQLLRSRLSLGVPVDDTLVEYCGLTNRTVTGPLRRNPRCRSEHGPRWERRLVAGDPARWNFDLLAVAAGFDPGCPGLFVTVDGRGFAGHGHCGCDTASGAGIGRPVHRFLPTAAGSTGTCPECRQPVRVTSFDRRIRVTAADLGPRQTWSLRRLGAGPRPVVVVGDGRRTVVLQASTAAGSPPVAEPVVGSGPGIDRDREARP